MLSLEGNFAVSGKTTVSLNYDDINLGNMKVASDEASFQYLGELPGFTACKGRESTAYITLI